MKKKVFSFPFNVRDFIYGCLDGDYGDRKEEAFGDLHCDYTRAPTGHIVRVQLEDGPVLISSLGGTAADVNVDLTTDLIVTDLLTQLEQHYEETRKHLVYLESFAN